MASAIGTIANTSSMMSANQAYKQAENMNALIRRSGDAGELMNSAKSTMSSQAVGGSSFIQSLSSLGDDALDKIRKGEKAAMMGVQGKASTVMITTAVQEAEITILEAKAMFEELLRAYRQIMSLQL